MSPHDALYKLYETPIIFYDQIGCGNSTLLPDKPASFWSIDFFMDELDNLLSKLGISDDFDLLGASWGGKSFPWLTRSFSF
jgi:pimeloyl-ACP methyl ester carboxylesterase